jgi:hypothetical protein
VCFHPSRPRTLNRTAYTLSICSSGIPERRQSCLDRCRGSTYHDVKMPTCIPAVTTYQALEVASGVGRWITKRFLGTTPLKALVLICEYSPNHSWSRLIRFKILLTSVTQLSQRCAKRSRDTRLRLGDRKHHLRF